MSDRSVRPGVVSGMKKNQKFHFVDALIVILILAILSVALYAYLPGFLSLGGGRTKNVEYTVYFLKPVDDETFGKTASDQTVLSDKSEFGKIKSVGEAGDEDLYPLAERAEGMHTVRLVITADARVKDSGITLGDKALAIGSVYPLILPAFAGEAVVTDITLGG